MPFQIAQFNWGAAPGNFLKSTLLIAVVASSGWHVPTQAQAQTPAQDLSDSVAFYAHGQLYGAKGRFTPDLDFIKGFQARAIAALRETIGYTGDDPSAVRGAIDTLVSDPVLAGAIYLDWLLEQVDTRDRGIAGTNAALREFYLLELQDRAADYADDDHRVGGIPRETAEALKALGISVTREPVQRAASISEYVQECRDAGIPVPDQLISGAGWSEVGFLQQVSGNVRPHNRLHIYLDDDPAGHCLLLARMEETNSTQGHVDMVCMGVETSNACFFETPARGGAVGFHTDVVSSPVTNLAGGEATEGAGGVGPCIRCHIGENPFIVHPADPAFEAATTLKSNFFDHPMHLGGAQPFQAVGVPGWQPNPPMLDILGSLPIDSGERRCSSCHRSSFGGRFPDIGASGNPEYFRAYCTNVLEYVVNGREDADGDTIFDRTMPLGDLDNQHLYRTHIEFLENMCADPDGEIVDNTFDDDKSVVSPPQVGPAYGCARGVTVTGVIDEARVDLFVNGTQVATIEPARGAGTVVFSDIPALVVGDEIQALQSVDGQDSALSTPVVAADVLDDYPDGLPAPVIDPATVFRCAEVAGVSYDITGFDLTLNVNGAEAATGPTFAGLKALRSMFGPFEMDDALTAQVRACSHISPVSETVIVQRAPAVIDPPARVDEFHLYEGSSHVGIGDLTFGSRAEVADAGGLVRAQVHTPFSWHNSRLGQPLAAGDALVVNQRLCAAESLPDVVQAPVVKDCTALPAPQLRKPAPGDDFVTFVEPVLGARFRIYDESKAEIGDGAGHVVALTRPLDDGEEITATIQVGSCVGQDGTQIEI